MTAAKSERGQKLYPWYVLALLFLTFAMNIADRQIIGILAEDIKADLGLSDSEIGLLAGPAISFFYAVLGIPMAHLADRVNRVRFLSICLAIWSFMTILGGRASGLFTLALTRIGVSIAEAGGTPTSASLIADIFPPNRRATATAIWTAGSTAGIFVGFVLGGLINAHVGWRNTFLVAGLPGMILALLIIFTVREPARGALDRREGDSPGALPMFAAMRHIWGISQYRRAILGAVCCNVAVFSIITWVPAMAARSHGVGSAEAGPVLGAGISIAGICMLLVAGRLTDWLGTGGVHRPLIATAASTFLAAVLLAAALLAPEFSSFAILLTIAYAFIMAYAPIVWVVLQNETPPEMRAMATAVMLLAIALLASVPVPLGVGLVSDLLAPVAGEESLRYALAIGPIALLGATWIFYRTGRIARSRV